MLSAGVYVCTFQPGNITGWGSEGVNRHCPCSDLTSPMLWLVLTGTACPVILPLKVVLAGHCPLSLPQIVVFD